MHRIDAIRFGIAGGIVSAFICFLLTLLAAVSGYGLELLNVFRSIFLGYEISVFGSLIGAVYGFMWGFVELFIIAFIYNMLGPEQNP